MNIGKSPTKRRIACKKGSLTIRFKTSSASSQLMADLRATTGVRKKRRAKAIVGLLSKSFSIERRFDMPNNSSFFFLMNNC